MGIVSVGIMMPDIFLNWLLLVTVFGATCVVMVIVWFSAVAVLLTAPAIKTRFMRAAAWINRICGAFFIMLGFRLALAKAPL